MTLDRRELTRRARELRRNPTPQERALWQLLRKSQLDGCKFTRQYVIDRCIVDFCCRTQRLVVEIDGGHHGDRADQDARRTTALQAMDFRVLRFWNNDVTGNLDGVIERIREALTAPRDDPPPNPLPAREGV